MAIEHINYGKGHYALVDSDQVSTDDVAIFSPDYWALHNAIEGQAQGRGTTLFIHQKDKHWVLRHYRRGGLIGKLIRDKYLFSSLVNTRPFLEFSLLATMRHRGLNVPKPIAAHVHHTGPFYRADLITERIDGATDVHFQLTQAPLERCDWLSIGEAIAKLHNQGVYHHDLNIRNIMRDNKHVVWIIDFDRCAMRSGHNWKQANLDRLYRSLQKERAKCPSFHWQPSDWAHLLDGYRQSVKSE